MRGSAMFSIFKRKIRDSAESVDQIQAIVWESLRPLGFRKYGRTFHRFVDGDISQVVHLQNGCPQKGVYGILWVNIGIRVPECAERKFDISEPTKQYYHEYECNIRTRLGHLADGKDTFYSLKKSPEKIGADIVARLKKYVLPIFKVLNSREAVLLHRADYPHFDDFENRRLLLDAAMIYGRRGDLQKASEAFRAYYRKALDTYNADFESGIETYLRKGEKVVYRNTKTGETQTVVADRDGYVTTYCADRGHVDYLENLAAQLGIVL